MGKDLFIYFYIIYFYIFSIGSYCERNTQSKYTFTYLLKLLSYKASNTGEEFFFLGEYYIIIIAEWYSRTAASSAVENAYTYIKLHESLTVHSFNQGTK